MEFGLSEEQTLLKDNVNRFLDDNAPLARVRTFTAAEQPDDADIWRGLSELGIPALLVPEAHGGIGLGMLDAAVVAESLGAHVTPAPYLSCVVLTPLALQGASDELCQRWLPGLATGEVRAAAALGEAVSARQDAGVTAKDGKLTGKSLFVLDAGSATDVFLVADAKRALYLVEAGAKGLTQKPLQTVERTRLTAEVKFSATPASLVSTDPALTARVIDAGRLMLAADTLGAAQYMLDQSVAYAKEREQFNRPIGSFQAVKHMCAEMAASLEPCRAMVWYAAHAYDHIPDEARLTACQTKAHLAEVGQFVARTATEVHGGMGFTDLLGLHYWFKRIGFNRQMLGAPELVREEAARLQGLVAA